MNDMAPDSALHNRYERNSKGLLCIDVAADKAEDLYNDYDRNAPYIRRDLDQDLVDYLIESASELRPQPFAIRFTFSQHHDEDTLQRIRNSVPTFFLYLTDQERALIRKLFFRSGVFLAMGVSILVGSVFYNQWLGTERSVIANVFAEGINIAAWVALWEALGMFLVEWYPHQRQLRLFRTLAKAPLLFR